MWVASHRWKIGLCVVLVGLAAAAGETTTATGRTIALSTSPVALGVNVSDPARGTDLTGYVSTAGRNPAIVAWPSAFDEPLYWSSQMSAVSALGAVPMVTWAPSRAGVGIPLRDIAAGTYDAYLKQQAAAAVAWKKPLFIRFAHEMNLPGSLWGPGVHGNTAVDFVNAWRHVVAIFRAAGASNVLWVWSPNANCSGKCPFDAFYPGDSWVDWVALDGYNYGPVDRLPWLSLAQIFAASYDDLSSLTSKPVMIGETASTELGGDKAAWIKQSLLSDLPSRLPRVRAVIWFQHVKETDWRVNSSAASASAFRGVASAPLYAADAASLMAIH